MRAFELRGVGLEHLVAVDRPEPVPGAGQVLMRTIAASLNARDLQIVRGEYPVAHGLPVVPLSDGVGEIVATGPGVTRVRAGQRVAAIFAQRWLDGPRAPSTWASTLGADRDGVLQELVVLDEDGVVPVPAHLTDVEAATYPTAGVAAWQALFVSGRIRPGDEVVVQGSGAVALFALQFARLGGARVVVTTRSPNKADRLLAAGAAAVVDATASDWHAQTMAATDGGADHVVDVTGDLIASTACLRIGGTVSLLGYLGADRVGCAVIPFLLANASVHGISVGPRSTFEAMNRALALHGSRPIIDSVHAFARARDAFVRMDDPQRFGKVVVRFDDL